MAGQERIRNVHGFAMAALLVALSVMAVMMTMAVPVWKTLTQREKEEELIWRGSQYVRAITLFKRKYANAQPPNLDILLNEKFLRKKYKDPMTKDGDFQLLFAGDQQQQAIQVPGGATQKPGVVGQPAATPQQPPSSSQLDPGRPGAAGGRGGIIGVVSKSKDASFRMFNNRSKYNEWAFTEQTVPGLRVPGGENPQGSPRPTGGMPGGRSGPGGQSGPGGAGGPGGFGGRTGPGGAPGGGQQRPFGLPTRPPD